jgi:WD40 repeat protein
MRLAMQDWKTGQIDRLCQTLDRCRPEPGQPDLRGWEWYYLLSLCHKDLMTLQGHNDAVFAVAWSPDGNRLASACFGGTGWVITPIPGAKALCVLIQSDGNLVVLGYAGDVDSPAGLIIRYLPSGILDDTF